MFELLALVGILAALGAAVIVAHRSQGGARRAARDDGSTLPVYAMDTGSSDSGAADCGSGADSGGCDGGGGDGGGGDGGGGDGGGGGD
jgi:hypothetical protein